MREQTLSAKKSTHLAIACGDRNQAIETYKINLFKSLATKIIC